MRRLGIIGCGRVGRVLARNMRVAGVVAVTGVVNRSRASAEEAVHFIGEGQPLETLVEMPHSDTFMIACSDGEIKGCAEQLAATCRISEATYVFHCSGAYSSELLSPLAALGAKIASIHPLKSFTDAQAAYESFSGTSCGIEGDQRCLDFLQGALARCGAVCFPISADAKLLYHAGAVFVCNYLTAVIEAGVRCCEGVGLERTHALQMLSPLITETVYKVLQQGTTKALTGPIARGEYALVMQQQAVVTAHSELVGEVYAVLGRLTREIAQGRDG